MAGTPGRSGGHNKRSAAEHKYLGTYKASRHSRRGELPPVLVAMQAPPERLSEAAREAWRDALPEAMLLTPVAALLLEQLSVHVAHARDIEARLNEAPGPNLLLLRALRAETTLIKALAFDLSREAGRVELPLPDGFEEFDNESPLDRLKRQARAQRQPSKWADMLP